MVRNSTRSRIMSPGLALLVLSLWLFVMLLKAISRQIKMNTINEVGKTVYQLLIEAGFNYFQAQLITAQAAHETANFTSTVFIQNKNLFGYKFVGQKIAKGERYGHAYYESIEDSIQDYKRYYNLNKYPSSFAGVVEFVKALKEKHYFEAPEQEYINGVRHFYNLYFNGE
jgi:uncharacterized FlgJ-related protein